LINDSDSFVDTMMFEKLGKFAKRFEATDAGAKNNDVAML
jgi:hypothetical protein